MSLMSSFFGTRRIYSVQAQSYVPINQIRSTYTAMLVNTEVRTV